MKSFISQLRWLFTPQDKRKFIFIAMLMAFSALLELAGIGILLAAATLFLTPESTYGETVNTFLAGMLPDFSPEIRIMAIISAIGILLAAKNIFAYGIVSIQSGFIFAKRNELARRLFSACLHAEHENFTRLPQDYCFGTFVRLNDVGNLVLLPAMQVLADVMVIGVLTVTAVILYPVISISGIGFMLLTASTVSLITSRINRQYGKMLLDASIAENQLRQTGIAGEKTIKCAAKEEYFLCKFTTAYENMNTFCRKLYNMGQLPRLTLESASILLATGIFAILILLGTPKMEIMLTFAILTAVVGRILPALSRCHYNLTLIRQNYPQLEVICDLLRELPQEKSSDAQTANAGETIEFKNITFAYQGSNNNIFENFDLTILPRTSLAISGRSGRGKSTLIDLLTGLLKPASGTICAGGIPIDSDLPKWRKQIGIVPQNIFLLDGTVAENVAFGEENIDYEKVRETLRLSGLADFAPEMSLTAIGNLSGGQRQRIGIARALYHDIKMLILDEATSALDAETENAFCEVLSGLKGKVTMVVISHRESTLNSCDRKLEL